MDKIIKFPDRNRIREQAAHWLVQLDKGDLSSDAGAEFRQWLKESPEHGNTLKEMARLWGQMDILAELSELFPLTRHQPAVKNSCLRFHIRPLLPMAAVLVLVIISVMIFMRSNGGLHKPGTDDLRTMNRIYRTAVGEHKNISLPDTSTVNLNTDSELQVVYNSVQRKVRLTRGEAHFQVAHDGDRPFLVFAGSGIVRAVGTAFSVHLVGGNVEVMVTEGKVGIAPGVEDDKEPLTEVPAVPLKKFITTLSAGQTAEYGIDTIHLVQNIQPEIMQRKLSWQEGMLKFEGEPLDRVVEEINRYTNTEIIITDPELRNIRVGGYFKTGETEALLNVLKDNFAISVNHVNPRLVYLTRADVEPGHENKQ